MQLTESRQFDDAFVHARAVPSWTQHYDQITAGRFLGAMESVTIGDLTIIREMLNQRVVQYGSAPAKMLNFCIPVSLPGSCSLQGVPVTLSSVLLLTGNEEFTFHLPPNVDYIQISVGYDELAVLAPRLAEQFSKTRSRHPVFQIPDNRLEPIRKIALEAFNEAVHNPDLLAFAGTQKIIRHQFISMLLDVLNEVTPGARMNITYATHCDIVKRSQVIVTASPEEPVSVLDLCNKLKVSRRTLQNSFQLITNTTPVDYLRSIRLNGVRRMLSSESPTCNTVREAAGFWGFYHLGHFSRDYSKLFNELPSETRSRFRHGH
ncbi:helix-turn-helix domain-containing protein [Leeia sp. TBRC 13508]|uniref:Helix-turn-helix domain-containing protein n=1 Tax=Leeia speluncae TaxID=2884804 RepID=A0ABS8D891_9NEIS|nr:helix-turn-helix domain-containing protein [Leeia speluncae]MCB6184417.1 helix-turn-helix domain-containing protein [Leeia speluncae]